MSEISGTITTGVTLGGTNTSPLTITSTGTVSDAAGDAVYAGGFYVNAVLINQGTVSATGGYGHDGVDFRNGGSVDNSRLIQGYFGVRMSNSAGTVTNSGTITGTFAAVNFYAGGSVGNSGLLQGRYGVLVSGSAGTVTNSATIAGTIISGVKLGKGGSVGNAVGGLIEGTGNASGVSVGGAAGTVTNYGAITGNVGIALSAGGSVDNAVGGLIQAVNDGVQFFNVAGTVTNSGTIASTNAKGVYLLAGGNISNLGSLALIAGYTFGVDVRGVAGTVTNSGTITGTHNEGVALYQGGSVGNAVGGLIQGSFDGVYVGGAAGTVTNSGRIIGTGAFSRGISLIQGGSVDNATGGLIQGYRGVYVYSAAGTVTNAGTIAGTSGIGIKLSAGGTVIDSGTISGTSAIVFGGSGSNLLGLQAGYKLIGGVAGGASASDTLALYGSIGAPVTVNYNGLALTSFEDVLFGPNGYATLQVAKNDGGTLGVTISGFDQSSEIIDLTGIGNDGSISYHNGSLITVTGSLGSVTLHLDGTDGSNFTTITDGGSGTELIACFARGTLIRTPDGEVPVEALTIGDPVVTASGAARPVRWIGKRAFDGRFLTGNTAVLPITISAGALADGVPARNLTLSPGHALSIDGALVPAEYLLNGTTVTQAESVDSIEYFHVELDGHDIIYAEGAANESYVDCDNRLMFANAAEFARLYPDDERPRWDFCAPRLDWNAPELAAIRERVLERATTLGHPGLDIEPDLRLVVDGAVLQPRSLDRQVHRFEVPAGAREVRLISRTTVPAYVVAGSLDPRRLGVPVECVALRNADLSTEVWHGELALGEGFHKDEATHCWTDGRALVPDELLRPFPGALTLEVRLTASELRYPLLPSTDNPRLGKAAPGRRSRDADLHLIVDGNVVRPLSIDARVHRFVIPGGAKEVTIASRSVVPRQAEDGSLDPRRLGVPVEQIALSGIGMRVEIDPACAALRDGFHRDEGSHRWTDGAGKLPAGLLAHFAEDVTIDVRIGATDLLYPVGEDTQATRPVAASTIPRRGTTTAGRTSSAIV